MDLNAHIEAVIFSAPNPVKIKELQRIVETLTGEYIAPRHLRSRVVSLQERYASDSFPFTIFEINGGYQFMTKEAYEETLRIALNQEAKRKLSRSALETLAIIAYKQPVTKSEIEHIRGVGADYAIQKLLEKSLILIKGKAPTPGRPLLYGTSAKFMEYFGINHLDDLPLPEELERDTGERSHEVSNLEENDTESVSLETQKFNPAADDE